MTKTYFSNESLTFFEVVDLKLLEDSGKEVAVGALPAGYMLKNVGVSVLNASSTLSATATLSVGVSADKDLFMCDVDTKIKQNVVKHFNTLLQNKDTLVVSLKLADTQSIEDGKVLISYELQTPSKQKYEF